MSDWERRLWYRRSGGIATAPTIQSPRTPQREGGRHG
jgi:hypothetical protein